MESSDLVPANLSVSNFSSNLVGGNLVFVTGGSGFIGGWCILALLEAGWYVRATLCPHEDPELVRAGLSKHQDWGDQLSFTILLLEEDKGWDQAMHGVTYVLHTASPVPQHLPKNEAELLIPARDGTLRVLQAAQVAGVKRVVITSSAAAITDRHAKPPGYCYDERDWSDSEINCYSSAYSRSKVLAEQAAWQFAAAYPEMELAVLNPVWVLGPVLHDVLPASLQVVHQLLTGKLLGYPRLGWGIVDVRDVAKAHLLAMTLPNASGERFLVGANWLWMEQMSLILRQQLPDLAKHVPAHKLPDVIVRALGLLDPVVRSVLPDLGIKLEFDFSKAHTQLGWYPRDVVQTIVDTGLSLYEHQLFTI